MIDATNPEIIMPEMAAYTATCRRKGCSGRGVATVLNAPVVDPTVVCGACDLPISDLVLVEQPTE